MKTTLELPDELFREVKATAARQGILMKQFIAQALEETGRLFSASGTQALDETRRLRRA